MILESRNSKDMEWRRTNNNGNQHPSLCLAYSPQSLSVRDLLYCLLSYRSVSSPHIRSRYGLYRALADPCLSVNLATGIIIIRRQQNPGKEQEVSDSCKRHSRCKSLQCNQRSLKFYHWVGLLRKWKAGEKEGRASATQTWGPARSETGDSRDKENR